jgi:HEAT repeat protein
MPMSLVLASHSAWGQSTAPTASDGTVQPLIEQLNATDLQTRRDAAWALADLGAAAAPAVEALTEAIDDDDAQVRNGALQALGRIGKAAEPAVPEIFAQLRQRDSQRRYRAAFALGRAAKPDDPCFLEGLNNSSVSLRAATVEAIGWMSEPPETLVAEVVKRLSDEDSSVATAAQGTLQKLGDQAVPPLIQALNKEDAVTQRRAAETLGLLRRPVGRDAETRLFELCRSEDATVQAAALTALAETAPDDAAVHRVIHQGLAQNDTAVVAAALSGVISLGTAAPESIPLLIEHVDSSPEIARLAAVALSRLGPTALPAVPLLLQKLTADNHALIIPAVSGLGPAAIPAIFQGGAEEYLTTHQAAEIIGRMGPRATSALEPALASGVASDRAIAAEAIGRVRRQPDTAELLVPLLADNSGTVRASAAAGLAQLGPLAKHTQLKLRDVIHDPEPAVRAQCLTALVAIGAAAEEITPAIIQGLHDESPQVRRQSAVAMGNLGPVSDEARAALVAALKDDDPLVRQHAAETLGGDPQTADAAAPALVATLQDPEQAVSLAAADALTRVTQLDSSAVAALLPLLDHALPDLRRTAITALATGGDAARQARDRLIPFQQDASATIRIATFRTLAALATDDAQRLEGLLAGLDDADWTVRSEITETLGELGERAAGAVPRLLELMRSPQDSDTASSALRRIDTAPADAIPMLLAILKDPDSNRRHRFYALHLLRKTGPESKAALPALRQLRDESEGRIREFYDRAIRDIE